MWCERKILDSPPLALGMNEATSRAANRNLLPTLQRESGGMVINMNSHKLGLWNIHTNRKNSLLIFQMVIVPALAAHSVAITSRAQSPTAQKQNSQTPGDTEPSYLINADRPGIADGSTVIGSHRIQIESGLQEEFRRDGDSHEHTLFFPPSFVSALIATGKRG